MSNCLFVTISNEEVRLVIAESIEQCKEQLFSSSGISIVQEAPKILLETIISNRKIHVASD